MLNEQIFFKPIHHPNLKLKILAELLFCVISENLSYTLNLLSRECSHHLFPICLSFSWQGHREATAAMERVIKAPHSVNFKTFCVPAF